MHTIERYLNIRSAYGASFTPDGRLVFLMDTTGVPQVWTLDEPEEWPEQRTFYDERVTFVDVPPERPELLFGMDKEGNERTQFYRLDPDGAITNLTQRPGAKHRFGGWSNDGDQFAFASNRRNKNAFDIYIQDLDKVGNAAELIHKGGGWLNIGDWSPSDDRLIISEAHSSFDQDLFVLTIETGDLHHLTPHNGNVCFQSASWAPNGDAIYLVTDLGADTLYLARLPVDGAGNLDSDLDVVFEGGAWNVTGVGLDDETGRLVYSRNADSYTELTVGELSSPTEIDEYPDPDLPQGVAGGVAFDYGAERFAVTVTGDTLNANVYVVDVETGKSKRWTRSSTSGIPSESFREAELVHYPTFDGLEIPAFFTLPADTSEGGTPVIADVHGGPESQRRPSFSPLKQYFLAKGYAVFEPNIRGSTGYGREYTHLDDVRNRMDAVRDIRHGIEWLHNREAVDPGRIVAFGSSYGGFIVLAALIKYPELWAAGVDMVGIANFVTFLENTGDWRRNLREAEYGSLEDDRAFLEKISPITTIHAIEAPLYVVHGANDPRVPVGEAEQIADEAAEHVPVEKLIFEDEGHGISKLENRIEAYSQIISFLNKYV